MTEYELDYLACNCARCNKELIGDKNPEDIRAMLMRAGKLMIAGRINSRPYCSKCYRTQRMLGSILPPPVPGLLGN